MKKHEFNAKGMACPLPVVQTKKLLAEYDVVETTVDNFVATENLTKLAEQLNYDIDVKKVSDEEYIVTISNPVTDKGNSVKEVTEKYNPPFVLCNDKLYIFIFFAIKEIDPTQITDLDWSYRRNGIYVEFKAPKKIIFYNGGVLLVDKNQSHVLEELKVLQENGVEIMSCGACIDYYKVDLAIGSTSNMYFIVEEMRAAGRVVRP